MKEIREAVVKEVPPQCRKCLKYMRFVSLKKRGETTISVLYQCDSCLGTKEEVQ